MAKRKNKFATAYRIMKKEGLINFVIFSLQRVQTIRQRSTTRKQKITMLASEQDIVKADLTAIKRQSTKSISGPCTISWVMSPPGESGGGHQNIFRFIKFLDEQGYRNYIYLYSTTDCSSIKDIKYRIKSYYNLELKNVSWLDDGDEITVGDALVATGWETAYPVYNSSKNVKKFYFVQDFEPFFYPMGSEYILAENTYRFGLVGITAGNWLATKLNNEYSMKCYSYDFGAEPKNYAYTNTDKRLEVFFYARPITARRGFELGILTLQKFHEMHPEYVINLAGWDVSEYEIPFPYINHKALKISELSGLYNRCAVALVISLTNMSLLPLELLAAGTIPVVNDAPNNRLVSNNPYIKYAPASPDNLAQAMHEIITMNNLPDYSKEASQSTKTSNWETAGEKVIKVIKKELHG